MAIAEPLPSFAPLDARTGRPLALTLQELLVTGKVLPVGARLFVRHLFTNGEKEPVEVVYAFALPRDGALRQFRIVGEGFSVVSELQPTKQAVETYEGGLARGHLATLARQYQDGVVNLSVGNLRPGETVAVFLELVAGVDLSDRALRFRFPFTMAPRYHAQARPVEVAPGVGEMQLPESFGDVLLPTWVANGERLHAVGFDLELALGGWGREVVSPSHPVRVSREDGGSVRVALARSGDIPNRDVILEARDSMPISCLLGGRTEEGSNHFALVVPSTFFGGQEEHASRNVVFVLDRSGSMGGQPISAAKKALSRCLGLLRPQDAFSLVVFDSVVESFSNHLVPGSTDNVEKARKFLASVDARGGTEVVPALEQAAKLLPHGGDAVLLTDGQVAGTDAILERARRTGLRIWCFGIGSASEDRFLNLLAQETGGQAKFLGPREAIEPEAEAFFKTVGGVVARDLEVREGGVDLLPKPPREVFAGVPLVLFGEASSSEPGTLTFRWSENGAVREREVAVPWGADPEVAETVKLLQGARLLTHLDAQWGQSEGTREKQRLERAMEEVSRRYGLASRVMSLVAVVKRAGDRPGEVPKVRVVPVGMPEDTAYEAYFAKHDIDPRAVAASRFVARKALRDSEFEPLVLSQPFEEIERSPGLEDLGSRFLAWLKNALDEDGAIRTQVDEERPYATLAALLVIHELLARGSVRLHQVKAEVSRLLGFVKGASFTGLFDLLSRVLDRSFTRWLNDHNTPTTPLLGNDDLAQAAALLRVDDLQALKTALTHALDTVIQRTNMSLS